MHRTPLVRITLAAVAAMAIAACQDNPSPTAVDPIVPSPNLQSAQGAALSDDDLDRQIPGFGGFFLDRDGSPTVYLARGASRASAERALAGYLNGRGLSTAAVRVREARYGWQQLQRWQGVATDGAFEVEGTVFVDNDETTNRIKIGIETLNAAGQVRAVLARQGVPDDAVIIEQVAPVVQVASLRDADRPVRAGVQINFSMYVCSVGFNALSGGVSSFVTASHCTTEQGGVESTLYWQPARSTNGTAIAEEVDDPTYNRGAGCPARRMCRYSDAARAEYINGVTPALGAIAKTSAANNNSLDITGSFAIKDNDCTQTTLSGGCFPVGTIINKVGRTTGWTAGALTNKCVNTGVQGSRIVQLCQNFVAAGVAGGDSGSDVFQIQPNSSTNVTLAGILWGGSGSSFVYSPFANVVKELGALKTF